MQVGNAWPGGHRSLGSRRTLAGRVRRARCQVVDVGVWEPVRVAVDAAVGIIQPALVQHLERTSEGGCLPPVEPRRSLVDRFLEKRSLVVSIAESGRGSFGQEGNAVD